MPYGPFPHGWPYSNFHDLNLDWVISVIRELETKITQFVALNKITYADPAQWDITAQYSAWTVVFNQPNKTVYLSIKPVPAGVQIDNSEYWTPIFNITPTLNDAIQSASYPSIVGSTEAMTDETKIYILSSNMHIYYYNGSAWTDSGYTYGTTPDSVHTYQDGTVVTSDNYQSVLTRAAQASNNSLYYISSTITKEMIPDLPVYGQNAVLMALSGYSTTVKAGTAQFYVTPDLLGFRLISNSDPDPEWQTYQNRNVQTFEDGIVVQASNYQDVLPNLTDALPNRIYYISSTITPEMIAGLPIYGYNSIFVVLSGYDSKSLTGSLEIFANSAAFSYRIITMSTPNPDWEKLASVDDADRSVQPYGNNVAVGLDNWQNILPDAFNPQPGRIYYISNALPSSTVQNLPVYGRNSILANLPGYSPTNKNGSMSLFTDGTSLYYSVCSSNAFSAWKKCVFEKEGSLSLAQILQEKPTAHIKLIGDSITQGVGGTGFAQDGDKIPTSTGNFHVNTSGTCWANMLKSFVESNYPGSVVKNWGTRGVNSGFIYQNLSTLIEDDDDVVILMIGTNNRGQSNYTRETCYNSLTTLFNAVISTGKICYFMAPPRANDGVSTNFTSEILEQIEIAALDASGARYISLYSMMTDFMTTTDKTYSDLLADNLHPNDYFYTVIYRWVSNMLGIGCSMT